MAAAVPCCFLLCPHSSSPVLSHLNHRAVLVAAMIRSAGVVNNGWLLFGFFCSQQRRCNQVQRHGWIISAARSGVSWLFRWPRRLLLPLPVESELTGSPHPCVFGGCVFSYYNCPSYRTPPEPTPLFNDVSVLLPQSLLSPLTSWLPLSLLFLWRRPSELYIAQVLSVDLLTTKKIKKIMHKVAPN